MSNESTEYSPTVGGEPREKRTNREWRTYIPPDSGIKTVMQILRGLNRVSNEGERALYEPQKQVIADIATALLHSHGPNGYIELPTGAGKTVIALNFLLSMDRDGVIAVPTKEIRRQFIYELTRMGARPVAEKTKRLPKGTNTHQSETVPDTEPISATPMRYTPLPKGWLREGASKHPLRLSNGRTVLVTTHSDLRDRLSTDPLGTESPRVLIVDEGHMAIGPQSREALAPYLEDPTWMVLALSATPEYTEASVGVRDHSLREHIGPCLHRTPFQEALDAGLVAPFRMSEMVVQPAVSEYGIKGRKVAQSRQEPLVDASMIDAIAQLLDSDVLKEKKVVIHCNTVDLAQRIQTQIQQSDPERAVVHINGGMSTTARETICSQYNLSTHGVLIGARIVGVGLDLADVDAAIIVGNTESQVVMMQAFGRALRVDPAHPDAVKELIHVRSSTDTGSTVQYMRELRRAGHIPPREIEQDPATGEPILKETSMITVRGNIDGASYSASLNVRGEVSPNAQWKPRDIPEGYVSWASVSGGRDRVEQETKLTILAVALDENPDLHEDVMIGNSQPAKATSSAWGLWVSPRVKEAYTVVEERMKSLGTDDNYVKAAQMAASSSIARDIIVRWIDENRDNPDIPELRQSVLGLVPRRQEERIVRYGFVVELFPKSIIDSKKFPQRLTSEELHEPGWYTISQLKKGDYPVPVDSDYQKYLKSRDVFLSFVDEYILQHPEANVRRRIRPVDLRDTPDFQYHSDVIEAYIKYMSKEYEERKGYKSLKELKVETGIVEHEALEYVESLPNEQNNMTNPALRRFAKVGHDPHGKHIRNDLLPGLVNWIIDRRDSFRNPSNLNSLLILLIQSRDGVVVEQALTRAIDDVMAERSVIIYQRGLRRAQERRAAVAEEKAEKSREQPREPQSAARELVTLILGEYDKYKSTPPDHTPLSRE